MNRPGKERSKAGDDAAARLYVVWNMTSARDIYSAKALTYIWGNERQVGEIGASPFTDQEGIIAVRSGQAGAGEWQTETRDLLADYRAFFKADPVGPVTGIAMMTDTDNTHGQATAWYGRIEAWTAQPPSP